MSDWNEDKTTYNGHSEVEIVIDRPVANVWKRFLDLGAWVINFDIKNVHGTPNTVGSVILAYLNAENAYHNAAKERGLPLEHYHYAKIIELIPERRLVFKIYSAKAGSYGMEITAFGEGRAEELGGKTKISYSVFLEYKGEVVAEAIAENPSAWDDDVRRSADGMLKNLGNLKRILEAGEER